MRLRAFKWALWFFSGAGFMVALFRFANGLGAVTALDDATPWGLWIGFDVMGGVALAAGGFVVAATVYVFRLERYHKYVRPAVLTAFLGYGAVIVGLLFDLGVPYNLWRPVVHWQHHSALFEVAWCVILYFHVLALEFAPVVLEKTRFAGLLAWLRKATIPLVMLGIMLSTLHQSSLGTLMVLMPARIHPLWYSPVLPPLFFVSAIGLGLMMVTAESLITAHLYDHKVEMETLSGLGRAASYVLATYLALRVGDLAIRGELVHVLDGSWESGLFLVEVTIAALAPLILLSIPRVRRTRAGLSVAAALTISGFVLNRVTTSGVATMRVTGSRYLPSLNEVLVSVGIVSATVLVFLFFVDHFKVYEEEGGKAAAGRPVFDGQALAFRREVSFASSLRRYSLPFVLAAASIFALMPTEAISGAEPVQTPVEAARGGDVLIIDGDAAGLLVQFNHREHVEREGGDASCSACHHMSNPFDQNTACAECHRDMFLATDIFDHWRHVEALNGNAGCSRCHSSPSGHTDGEAVRCETCHEGMRAATTRVVPRAGTRENQASGYRDAMHGLCVGCHGERSAELDRPALAQCAACHGEVSAGLRRTAAAIGSKRGLTALEATGRLERR